MSGADPELGITDEDRERMRQMKARSDRHGLGVKLSQHGVAETPSSLRSRSVRRTRPRGESHDPNHTTMATETDDTYQPDGRPTDTFGIDDLFRVLSNARRRWVIDQVGTCPPGEAVTLDALARGRAFLENDGVETLDGVTSDQRKRVFISLYQNHLPLLDELGVVDCSDDYHVVRATGRTLRVRAVLVGARELGAGWGWSA